MNIIKSDWSIILEAEKDGMVVAMTSIIERVRTDLNIRLSKYFRERLPKYTGTFYEDVCEDVLYSLNLFIEQSPYNKRELDFPLSEGTDIHLLHINENISLKVIIADESYGSGNYDKYIDMSYFIINENTTENDVDVLVDFISEHLNYLD